MARLSYIAAIIGIALTCVIAQDFYDDRYDDVDINAILANNKLREQYLKCFLETTPCVTAIQKWFKEIFSEAFLTKCRRCTEKQKEKLDILADWYTINDPDNWQALIEKATNNFRKKNANR